MSRAVFGSFIHHNPTKGGAAENNKFQGMYNYTLLLYERVLGAKPSAKYWPAAARRFSQEYT